ncbi:MAG: barstar family protein [Sporolactobacillus sp.]
MKDYISIDLRDVTDSEELQIFLQKKLDFPDFYGKNWDAFWDTITGLKKLPQNITFKHWDILKKRLPEDAESLMELLNDFNEEYPEWKINWHIENK